MSRRRLAGLDGRRILKALQRASFETIRVSGSHHVLRKPGSPASTVIIPVHGAGDLPAGTLRSIVKQAGMTIEEFIDLL